MLGRIANLTTLRNLTGLSRSLVKQGNISNLRCYSTKLAAPMYSGQFSCLPKQITLKNALCPTSSQLTKITANSLIQTRSQSTHGDHVNLWKLERIVSAAFVPLLPLCLMLDNPVLDGLLAVLSVIHVHWGLEAIILDYARPIVVGPIVPKVCFVALYLVSALTLAGLLVLVYNGPGISKVIKQGWSIGKDK
ncbi:succinate dehydrogenase [ubiquinone] cytochrome b small subunit, mitochondrial isoform X1 [Nasonia vitripennis]|uniref:Succinate dehydrogenase [ubiquinone] cytochrome b small subunit n=1 Tax=Nasonia vitripennis TaxID=7425 RepID=A0A7M7QTS5_NASVI|nr:succinate dehydrogenase [ubiquinone] cytochrome b small subunit, mitochondrial [Nasonia vitripennis]NP_001165804.1 succinate dehydrogenase [ubiquinone] cytochrome b small subunit, mitochondrial [Nasonia vitripennis]XP_016841996.1 succinate dehydrogenase [ubiquinone] cytochrome b small subunit, mitochondrial isoform X1 [Nasonia vitripennis]XP_032454669.1 succinate dehydrogenase [ubiquinone] cytochrome b small subunit, mitochondrial isoform X1 [Nasonia vitripennis]